MNHANPTPFIQDIAETMLTTAELAKRWKISTKTIIRIARDRVHGIRYFQIRKQLRFRLHDVEAYEKRNRARQRMF